MANEEIKTLLLTIANQLQQVANALQTVTGAIATTAETVDSQANTIDQLLEATNGLLVNAKVQSDNVQLQLSNQQSKRPSAKRDDSEDEDGGNDTFRYEIEEVYLKVKTINKLLKGKYVPFSDLIQYGEVPSNLLFLLICRDTHLNQI